MNADEIEGNWKQFKGDAQVKWARLTGDDLAAARAVDGTDADAIDSDELMRQIDAEPATIWNRPKATGKSWWASSRNATARPRPTPSVRWMNGSPRSEPILTPRPRNHPRGRFS